MANAVETLPDRKALPAPPATAEDRVTFMVRAILSGATRPELHEAVKAGKWGLKKKETEDLITRAYHEIGLMASEDREEAFGTAVARLHQLYARSLRIQDYKVCLAVQKELNRLYGI